MKRHPPPHLDLFGLSLAISGVRYVDHSTRTYIRCWQMIRVCGNEHISGVQYIEYCTNISRCWLMLRVPPMLTARSLCKTIMKLHAHVSTCVCLNIRCVLCHDLAAIRSTCMCDVTEGSERVCNYNFGMQPISWLSRMFLFSLWCWSWSTRLRVPTYICSYVCILARHPCHNVAVP